MKTRRYCFRKKDEIRRDKHVKGCRDWERAEECPGGTSNKKVVGWLVVLVRKLQQNRGRDIQLKISQ